MAEGAPIDDAGSRELAIIMRAAARRARQEILNPTGSTDKARLFNAARAASRLKDLERDLRILQGQANGVLNKSVRRSYERGIRDAERMARDAGLTQKDSPIVGSLTGAETVRAGVLVRRATGDIDKAFGSMKAVTGRTVRQANALGLDNVKMRRLLAGGAIDGAPAHTLHLFRQQIRKIVNQDGLVEVFSKRTGAVMTFKPDYYADLVYQTAMAEASVIGEIDRLSAKGHDLVKIIGSHSVHFCTAFVDKVFSLSGTSAIYPAYRRLPRGGPPFHPRCTKRIVPFNERLASPAERKKAKPDEETSKLLDRPPEQAQQAHEKQQAARPAPAPATPRPPAATPPKPDDSPVVVQKPTPPTPGEPIPQKPLIVVTRPATSTRPARVVELKNESTRRSTKIDIRSPAVAESAVRTAQRVHDKGFELPLAINDTARLKGTRARTVPAYYTVAGGDQVETISVNTKFSEWPKINELVKTYHGRKYFSSADPDHIFLHELGHHVHVQAAGRSRVGAMIGQKFTSARRTLVAEAVSEYAATQPVELVAEMFAALMAGKRFPAELMALYRSYGGVW